MHKCIHHKVHTEYLPVSTVEFDGGARFDGSVTWIKLVIAGTVFPEYTVAVVI